MKKKKKKKDVADDSAATSKLTPKQKLFCELYLDTMNAGYSYCTAYKVKEETGWSAGSRMLRNVKVAEYLSTELDKRIMGSAEILSRLADQARGDITTFIKIENGEILYDLGSPQARMFSHLIKKVKTRTTESPKGEKTQWVEVEIHDPQKALEDLGRYHKLFTERIETNTTVTIPGLQEMLEKAYKDKK